MLEIYSEAFSFRQKVDYEVTYTANKEQLEESFKEAVFFVEEVKKYLAE